MNANDSPRMPTVFVPHGGGPWPFVDLGLPEGEVNGLIQYLQSVRHVPPIRPKALLVISAHWEERVPTVMTAERPSLLYDYSGFPPQAYTITWPAPGAPWLAGRVQDLLREAAIPSATDDNRGFDHGTFVPLKVVYPDADLPAIQLSLKRGLDPAEHLAVGRALQPLRDDGVFIIGSGMTFHDLRALNDVQGPGVSETFDAWLREAATREPGERDRRLADWEDAPNARRAHPREEHLAPLFVIAGAAGADRGRVAYQGTMFGWRLSAYHFGTERPA
jgi:aromatic ring-opening dioxygenase catalytic subunit (LigB family)